MNRRPYQILLYNLRKSRVQVTNKLFVVNFRCRYIELQGKLCIWYMKIGRRFHIINSNLVIASCKGRIWLHPYYKIIARLGDNSKFFFRSSRDTLASGIIKLFFHTEVKVIFCLAMSGMNWARQFIGCVFSTPRGFQNIKSIEKLSASLFKRLNRILCR